MRQAQHIYSIPASVPFLTTFVDALVDGALVPGFRPLDDPLALADATIYLPTRRSVRLLPEIFQKRFDGRAGLLPKIRPVGDVDEDLQDVSGLGDLEPVPPAMPLLARHIAMTRLVKAWKGMLRREALNLRSEEPLGLPASTADAAWLAADLLALMDEVETEEASWTHLADLVPEDFARYWQITLDFLKIVSEAWPQFLDEQGEMDPKARRSFLIRREAAHLKSVSPSGPVIVAGVTGSVPATAELLKVVANLPNGAIVLPGLDCHMDRRSWAVLNQQHAPAGARHSKPDQALSSHPQYSLKQLLNRLGVTPEDVQVLRSSATVAQLKREQMISEVMRPAETSDGWTAYLQKHSIEDQKTALQGVAIMTARNEADEALSVAVALREAMEKGESAALVSADRTLARRVAAELARWNIQADDSAGSPLAQTAPAVLAILAAKLALNGCEPIDLLALLKHPLARLGLPIKEIRSAARALERGVLRGPRALPGTAGLAEAVRVSRLSVSENHTPRWKRIHDEDWDVIEDLVRRLSDAIRPLEELSGQTEDIELSDLAGRHIEVLEAITRDEEKTETALYDTEAGKGLASFFASLLEASQSDLVFNPQEWPSLLPPLMSGQVVRNRLPGDMRVRILGPMEARLQSFDFVILAGLNEGVWPQRTRNDPWLSRPMKKEMGLEPPERRLGAAAHDFSQGLAAQRVLLSRAARADGAPTVASRWLQRLTTLIGPELTKVLNDRGATYTRLATQIDEVRESVPAASRPNPTAPISARPNSLSITEIERLIRDPYAIYARHVLDLQAVDPIGGQPGAADKGNLIHDALVTFLSAWSGPFDESAILELTTIGEQLFEPFDAFPLVRAFWWPRFLKIAEGFVDYESKRSPEIDQRFLEIGGGVELNLPGVEFRLRGRADRIDLLKTGGLSVIDYKTGQVPSQKQVDALLSPQLPLEAAMIKRGGFKNIPTNSPISELLYLQLKGGQEAVIELDRTPREQEVEELVEDAWKKLEQLISHYAKPESTYLSRARVVKERQMDGAYDHLARTQEWSLGFEEPV